MAGKDAEVTSDLKMTSAAGGGAGIYLIVQLAVVLALGAFSYFTIVPMLGDATSLPARFVAYTQENALVWQIPAFFVSCYVAFRLVFSLSNSVSSKPAKLYERAKSSDDFYDVAIVGSGPSGSVCSFYLTRDHKARVLVLEKKKFPRDKYCGDAVPAACHPIMDDMGVLKQILDAKKGHPADNGGMISPGGLTFIGRSAGEIGRNAVIGIRRIVLDEHLAMASRKAGTDLKENSEVMGAKFDRSTGLWTIEVKRWEGGADNEWAVENMTGENKSTEVITYKARALVCADGATSTLARKLGIVKTAPEGVCSRAYVQGDSHNFKADGVVFYPPKLLPGYCSVFRVGADQHDLSFCCYIIPGNPKVTEKELPTLHHDIIKNDPYVSKALGPNAKLERMKAASLRLGGVPKSYGEHVVLVGDAAGTIDPLTGEGIHTAMITGKMASIVLGEAIKTGNYSEGHMAKYHAMWMKEFGADFYWSMKGAQLLYKFPLLLDAACAAVQRKGPEFLGEWALIMTNQRPKIDLIKPRIAFPIVTEIISQFVQQKILGRPTPRSKIDKELAAAKKDK